MQSKGFTIIELLITVFILSIGVIGIYSAFSAMIVFTNNASDQLQAAYLAQEGMEIIRNIRDTNWIHGEGEAWIAGLESCDMACEVDYTTTGEYTNPVIASVGDFLSKDNNGFYRYSTPAETIEDTKFQRKIKITGVEEADVNHFIDVVVEVSWNKKRDLVSEGELAGTCGAQNCVIVKERLYDWY